MTATDVKTAKLHRSLAENMDTETADALIERLPPDWEQLATKTDLEGFATKADLERFATKADLERFATKADLERFATKADLEGFATKADLAELQTDLSRDLRVVMFTIVGFGLAVVGMFATILLSGVPAAG